MLIKEMSPLAIVLSQNNDLHPWYFPTFVFCVVLTESYKLGQILYLGCIKRCLEQFVTLKTEAITLFHLEHSSVFLERTSSQRTGCTI